MIVRILLDIGYVIALAPLLPLLLYRMIAQGRYRDGWKERLGFVTKRYSSQPAIWIHAVSMGEINAIGTLVASLRRVLPQYEIIITTTTDTGMARARKLYSRRHRVFFFPWDLSFAVARTFARIRPSLCILMEGEIWPNFTALAAQREIPVVIVNARISNAKGWPRYRRTAPLVRPMFRRLSLVLAQDQEYARRFRYLGVPADRVQIVGTLKYDTAEVVDTVPGSDKLAEQLHLAGSQMIWVAGGTGPGEEEIVLQSWEQLRALPQLASLRLVIVPRKPERFDDVARQIESRSHRLLRYSRIKSGEHTASDADDDAVILVDTMGDLRKFYSLATIVFVGRSLTPMGGSDMMEAAALAKPVIVGPHTENFTETVAALRQGEGIIVVPDGNALTEAVKNLLADPPAAHKLAAKGRAVIIANRGATHRTTKALVELLNYQMPPREGAIATETIKTTRTTDNISKTHPLGQ